MLALPLMCNTTGTIKRVFNKEVWMPECQHSVIGVSPPAVSMPEGTSTMPAPGLAAAGFRLLVGPCQIRSCPVLGELGPCSLLGCGPRAKLEKQTC